MRSDGSGEGVDEIDGGLTKLMRLLLLVVGGRGGGEWRIWNVEWSPIHAGAPMRRNVSLSTCARGGDFLKQRDRADALRRGEDEDEKEG